ncbi:S-layer protein [Cytobacillus pseudoceanisediminis]|uniref:S-layer protein n=1 Tax=Cytobacillus pseudoceanisediminis TaxID=3051614 RepID=UPI003C2B6D3D
MAKKKAIKLAAASAVAASAFVAAAPAQTDAASNVAVEVSKAVTQMKKAYHTYSDVTAQGKFAPIADVYKEYNAAKKAYANAKALVNKAGGADKDKHLATLEDTYAEYIAKRVITYIDAYNYATTLQDKQVALEEALENNDWDAAEDQYHAISYELKTRTVILDRVYGKSTRELLRGSFKADAQAARDSIQNEVSVKIYFDKAEGLLNEGKLEEAKAAMDHVADYVAKLDKDTDFGAALLKKVEDAEKKLEELSVPKVESVSAINAKQLVVKFNKPVSKNTVIGAAPGNTLQNITIVADADAEAVSGFTGSLSEDGKELTVTASTGFFKGAYTVTATDSVKSTDNKALTPYIAKITAEDKVAPTVSGVVYNQVTDKFEVSLSEPISSLTGQVIRVNGNPVASFDAISAPTKKLTFDRPAGVSVGSTVELYVAGVKDAAGNLLTSFTGSVVLSQDQAALAVASVNQVSNNVVRVTFNKKLSTASDTALLAKTGVVVTKQNGATTTNFTVANAPSSVDPNGVAYDITFADATFANANTETFTLTLVKDAFTDVVGNKNNLFAQTVTLTKDATAPAVVSSALASDKKGVEVTLSEAVTSINNANVKLRKDGAELTGVTATLKSGTNNVLVVKSTDLTAVNADGTLKPGSYQVRFEGSAFTDLNAVPNAAVNVTPVSVAATPGNPLSVAVGSGGTNIFTVTAPAGQTFTTGSLAYTNFAIDGKVIPSNSDITLDPTRTVISVKLPSTDSVKISGNALFAVTGLGLESGSAVSNTTATVSVVDNTAPTLQSAALVGSNVLKLTFDENIKSSVSFADATDLIDDIEISNGSVTYNAGAAGAEVDGVITSVNGKEVVITITPQPSETDSNWSTIAASSTITVKTLSGAGVDIVDTNNVALRSNVTKAVTK